jgi:thioredoxin reductase (NADPH)
MIEADPDNVRFPVLDQDVLDQLAGFGEEREVSSGEVLFRAGDAVWDWFVVLSGEIEITTDDDARDVIVTYTDGQFIGELGLLTGQRAYLTARVVRSGRALVVPHDAFRRMMATKPSISDVIFAARLPMP